MKKRISMFLACVWMLTLPAGCQASTASRKTMYIYPLYFGAVAYLQSTECSAQG